MTREDLGKGSFILWRITLDGSWTVKAEGFHDGRVDCSCRKGYIPARNTTPQRESLNLGRWIPRFQRNMLPQSSGFRSKFDTEKSDERMWFDNTHGKRKGTKSGLNKQEWYNWKCDKTKMQTQP